jgi:predicted negative regulator of RcsB-dependent stress response
MALDPDQERIEKEIKMDKIQNLWNTYRKKILIIISIISVAFIGFEFNQSSVRQGSEEASQIYQEIIMKDINDIEVIKEGVARLKDNYSDTPYASRGSIYLSRSLVHKKMNDEAISELIWAADNANEKSIQSLALYTLSNIYLISKNIEEAMVVANKISTPGYIGLKNDLLGDIYMGSNDKEKARISYGAALNFYQNKSELAKVIQTKIDAIGQ